MRIESAENVKTNELLLISPEKRMVFFCKDCKEEDMIFVTEYRSPSTVLLWFIIEGELGYVIRILVERSFSASETRYIQDRIRDQRGILVEVDSKKKYLFNKLLELVNRYEMRLE